MEYQDLLDRCHLPFKYYEHEFLQGKYIYIRIQATVQRLNSLGVPWSFEQGPVEFTEKFAHTHGQLMIQNMGTRGAPGAAALHGDADNAAKAAHSFALRKAASLFGVSHYLMQHPKEETAFVNFMNSADLNDVTDLKRSVKLIADIDGVTPKDWLSRYDVVDSNNAEQLKAALTKAGRI